MSPKNRNLVSLFSGCYSSRVGNSVNRPSWNLARKRTPCTPFRMGVLFTWPCCRFLQRLSDTYIFYLCFVVFLWWLFDVGQEYGHCSCIGGVNTNTTDVSRTAVYGVCEVTTCYLWRLVVFVIMLFMGIFIGFVAGIFNVSAMMR